MFLSMFDNNHFYKKSYLLHLSLRLGSSLQLTGTPLLAHSLAKAATMEHIGYASLLRLHMSFLHMVMNLLNSIFALQSLKIGLLIAAGQVLSARSEALNGNIFNENCSIPT